MVFGGRVGVGGRCRDIQEIWTINSLAGPTLNELSTDRMVYRRTVAVAGYFVALGEETLWHFMRHHVLQTLFYDVKAWLTLFHVKGKPQLE
jgi:hypothetical protein